MDTLIGQKGGIVMEIGPNPEELVRETDTQVSSS